LLQSRQHIAELEGKGGKQKLEIDLYIIVRVSASGRPTSIWSSTNEIECTGIDMAAVLLPLTKKEKL
jgi:hypothetical protein